MYRKIKVYTYLAILRWIWFSDMGVKDKAKATLLVRKINVEVEQV